ncbi:hypothetical protein E2C01_043154 [Portunus trituberculatus]|uniref:Uncharacterized protein n=1 Tax=Portunus trituberculatus TaxID=210409 RepID=A0A5B7FVI9_PORTR|nr:hypothetical protein [Portunus trituberculatus]
MPFTLVCGSSVASNAPSSSSPRRADLPPPSRPPNKRYYNFQEIQAGAKIRTPVTRKGQSKRDKLVILRQGALEVMHEMSPRSSV